MDYYIVNGNENEMITRQRLYYPASQIIQNLYTAGKEYMTADNAEYIGFYHRYIDSTIMTGAVYDSVESKVLKVYVDTVTQPESILYTDSIENGSNSRTNVLYTIHPVFTYVQPQEKDFVPGKFKRYFIKRRNYQTINDIFEIDQLQYKLWKQIKSGIDENLYTAISIDWLLVGPLHDVTENGIVILPGVSTTNERIVRNAALNFIGLDSYVTDFIELSTYSKLCPAEFKRKFGYLTN